MNWTTLQYNRARHLNNFNNIFWVTIKYLAYIVGLASLGTLAIAQFLSLPAAFTGLSLLLTSPAVLLGSYQLFISYLELHPGYLMPKVLRREPLNNFDFTALKFVNAWQRGNWQWTSLAKVMNSSVESQEVFYRLGLSPQLFSTMAGGLDQATAEGIISTLASSVSELKKTVNIYDFLHALLLTPSLSAVLVEHKVNATVVDQVLAYYKRLHEALRTLKTYWLKPQLHRGGGFAKDWSVSYTTTLDDFTTEIPPEIDQRVLFTPLGDRDEVVDEAVSLLNKDRGQNLLLVGDSGSGKTEIFYHLASRVIHFETHTSLDGAHVRTLDYQKVISVAGNKEDLQKLMDILFGELSKAGNIVLFLDQINLLLNPGGKIGTTDLSAVLQSYLNHPQVRVVGTITNEDYVSLIKNNQILSDTFSIIKVEPPKPNEMLPILLSQISRYENRYGVFFTAEALETIIELSPRYLKDQHSPQRELTLIEEVAASPAARDRKVISEPEVLAVLEKESGVPIQVAKNEKSTLLNLAAELHKSVVGQDRAIQEISDALLRARAGLAGSNKPIGSFLFLGPTGVGKTETAKTLAKVYFGGVHRLIRLDMSEFADANGLQKLLGSNLVSDPGALSVAIQENPSAVILFDEIEKSHQYVQNALLQLLDEGRLTTNYGKTLDFTNTIVIATSNAGSDYIRSQVTNNVPVAQFEKALIDQLISKKIFLTEFLNRFDGVIVFAPLKPEEVEQIVGLQINEIKSKLYLDKEITLEVAPAVLAELSRRGYDPVFGARALQRVIKNDLETVIAREIISQSPARGATLKIESI